LSGKGELISDRHHSIAERERCTCNHVFVTRRSTSRVFTRSVYHLRWLLHDGLDAIRADTFGNARFMFWLVWLCSTTVHYTELYYVDHQIMGTAGWYRKRDVGHCEQKRARYFTR